MRDWVCDVLDAASALARGLSGEVAGASARAVLTTAVGVGLGTYACYLLVGSIAVTDGACEIGRRRQVQFAQAGLYDVRATAAADSVCRADPGAR